MYFWNPSSIKPSGCLNDFWASLVSLKRAVALVSYGKKVDSKLDANLSKVFSVLAMEVSAILSYHIFEKETPRPLLILLSVVMTLSVSEV